MPGLRIKKAIVGVKLEASAFTYGEPGNSDSFPAFDIEVSMEGENYQRKDTTLHFGKQLDIPGPATGTISFKLCFVGGTAVAIPPYYAQCLRACGLREVITPTTGPVTYTPWSTYDGATPANTVNPGASYTVAVWEDGIQYAIKGATGTLKLACKMGEPMVWEFTFKGAYVAPANDSFPTVTVTTLAPPTFLGAALSFHGNSGANAPTFTEFTLDMGNDVQNSENANDSSGIRGSVTVDRRIVLSINPEQELVSGGGSALDFFGKWRSGAIGIVTWGPIGPTAGNKITFTTTATASTGTTQIRAPKMADRNGIRTLDLELPVVTTGAEGTDFSIAVS